MPSVNVSIAGHSWLIRTVAAGIALTVRDRTFWLALGFGVVVGALYFGLRLLTADAFKPGLAARVALYYFVFTSCSLMALYRGGAPERWMALALAWPIPAFYLARAVLPHTYLRFDAVQFSLDVMLLATMAAVMLRANRYWPILAVAIQICPIAFQLTQLQGVPMHPLAYGMLQVLWSYLALIVLAVGVWRHQGRKQARGIDRDWSIVDRRGAREAECQR